jgi:NAD(P)-dependent dehydrogenase (short-subunit alcohol dehydrogenase family)
MSTQHIDSQVVVVIGASSGIGRETALRYASRNACLVLAARSENALHDVADDCRAIGATDVVVQPTDIAAADQVQELFDVTIARFGRADIVAQCAAITAFGRFEDVPAEVFDDVVKTNLLGAANVARSALHHFQEQRSGHLVLVGSLLGMIAVPYQSPYVLSKFALSALVRVLRQENRHLPDVRIHGIYPGPVDTPVYGTAGNYSGLTPKVPPTADAPAVVAAAIVRATDRRRSSERQVGLLNWPAILAFRLLPTVFDAVVGPFVRAASFDSDPSDASAGNVRYAPSAVNPRESA